MDEPYFGTNRLAWPDSHHGHIENLPFFSAFPSEWGYRITNYITTPIRLRSRRQRAWINGGALRWYCRRRSRCSLPTSAAFWASSLKIYSLKHAAPPWLRIHNLNRYCKSWIALPLARLSPIPWNKTTEGQFHQFLIRFQIVICHVTLINMCIYIT